MNSKTKIFFSYSFIFIIVFFLDRFSKLYVVNLATNSGYVDIQINNYLNIFLIWNTGIGFGLLSLENNIFYNNNIAN